MVTGAASIIDKVLRRYRLSDLTPILSPTEDNFFYCENNKKQSYIGASFIATTLNGMDEVDFQLFAGSISVKLPANSIIQFTHIATNHIEDEILDYVAHKEQSVRLNSKLSERQKTDLIEIIQTRVKALREGTVKPIVPSSGITLRSNRLVVSVKVPADLKLSEYDMERAKEQILSVYDNLKNSVMGDIRQLTKEEFVAQVRSILYPYKPLDYVFDDNQKVSEQMFQKTTAIDNRDPNFVKIDDTYFSVLSVKALPKQNTIALMNNLVGDHFGSTKQVSCPFMVNCTIIIPDIHKENNSIDLNYTQTQDTATPFALKMSPKLRERLNGLTLMFNETKQGELPCKLYFNIVLFNKDKLRLQGIAARLQNYYKTDGLSVVPDNKIVLPLLWNALPLYPSLESLKNTNRMFTMTIKHAASFAPIFSDYRNIRSGYSQIYYTRRGNLYGFDPMRGQNHNGLVFGSSGGGKSATVNNFIEQEYESGAMIRIIDEGRSYKKLCAVLGGTFIEFTDKSHVCLNPFTLVTDIHSELEQLSRIVKQMASPSTPLDDYLMSMIKKAIVSSFNMGAQKTTITDVADFLAKQDDENVRKLGRQLYDYTDRGSYGKYFDGDNNLNLDAQMVVLELEGLKAFPELKTVVMMVLLARIQNDMFFNSIYPRKFVIFEEVTSYLAIPVVAQYIDDFYMRIRKYRAGCWLVTQNIEKVAQSEAIKSIINNANYVIYLPYKTAEIKKLVENGYVKNDPFIIKTMESLRLFQGQYSEAMIFESDTDNISTIRIVFNESEKVLYSSSGDYFIPFLNRLDAGEPVKDIIQSYLAKERDKISTKGSVEDRDIQDLERLITTGEVDLKQALLEFKKNIVNRSARLGE